MRASYDLHAPKKAANLSINADLLSRARSMDIKLSATLEQALIEILRKRQAEEWLAENRTAIEAYTPMSKSMACSATGCAASDAAVHGAP